MGGISGSSQTSTEALFSNSSFLRWGVERPPMHDEISVHVIDDDEAVRASFGFLLKTAGIPSRGYDSAEVFLAEHPDLKSGCVVTDMRLPGMTGLDLLRHIKGQVGASVSVIVITAHGDIPLAVE